MGSEVIEIRFDWTRWLDLLHPTVRARVCAGERICGINEVRPAADPIEKLTRGCSVAGGEI